MDGYFAQGLLVEGSIITDDRGKIEIHTKLNEYRFY